MQRAIYCLWLMATVTTVMAQNLVPNPSFELGETNPEGWRLTGGVGKWEIFGHEGKRCVSVTGKGDDSNSWECTAWKPEGGKLYLICCFILRSPNSQGGTPITGFSTVNCDVWDIPSDGQWHLRQFICRTPINRTDTVLRFGQWHVKGTVSYDDLKVLPVVAIHRRIGKTDLGSGESIRNGFYRFVTNFGWFGGGDIRWLSGNDSRPLFAHTAGFNTDRWVLGGPMSERWQESRAWVIYRHTLNGTWDTGRRTVEKQVRFETATITFTIGYYEGGQLVVEASRDGKEWREIGRFSPSGQYTTQVPADLFPADELWTRFWATGVLQVNAYQMEAKLLGNLTDAIGETWYFAVTRDMGQRTSGKALMVEPLAFTDRVLLVRVQNKEARRRQIAISIFVGENRASLPMEVTLPPNSEQTVSVPLPKLQAGNQVVTLQVEEGGKVMYEAQAHVRKAWIEVGRFGYHLAETKALNLWWCEANYKIGRTIPCPMPPPSRPIHLEAARNEYEPFQIVLTPKVPIKELRLCLEPFVPSAHPSPRAPCPVWDEVALVEYVPVTIPTDAWGAQGDYPDPLIPLWRRDRWQGKRDASEGNKGQETGGTETEKAIDVRVSDLQPNENQPLWLTVFVPKNVPAGTYRAKVHILEAIGIDGKPVPCPLSPVTVELRVFNFTLPDETPLRTAYGVHIDNDWHRLKTDEQFRQVWDLYMQTCRRYRISPYTPHAYAPIRWEVSGPRATIDNGVLELVIDRWQGRIASVQVKGQPICGVLPLLEQFEKEGVGWEGKGISWVGTEVIKDVRFVESNQKRLVMDITAERLTSSPANRKFSAEVRLTVEAGKPYFSIQLLRITNTDSVRWRANVYFHLLPPDEKPSSAINSSRFGAWVFAKAKQTLAFGAAGDGFRYSLRINPQTGHPHGDVMRDVGKWLEPGEAWEPKDEPTALMFIWDAGRGTGNEGTELAKFAERMLLGKIVAQPSSKLQIREQPEPKFRYDFTEFDEAMSRYLDGFHFNGFNFVILPETLGGHPRFSPEWTSLYKGLMAPVIEHLSKKGWLKKAYCYWVDEPPPERYEDVKRGMAMLKGACPGVRRLLTINHEKAPTPTFYDFVDLWVPIFHLFDPQRARERQALGEEVWWYVCTGPKQPYPNNFIDHPAITHRIRYWMAAKWNLDGDLYWSMTYYRGKGYRLRNPYENGQSETPDGGYWGNGDGRLLYPPVRQPLPENAEPLISPPIPSLRLALIAEGIEDHAYFWMLKELRKKGQEIRGKSEKLQAALKMADEALGALDRLIKSQTDYELDPKKLYAERREVAEALEALANLVGMK